MDRIVCFDRFPYLRISLHGQSPATLMRNWFSRSEDYVLRRERLVKQIGRKSRHGFTIAGAPGKACTGSNAAERLAVAVLPKPLFEPTKEQAHLGSPSSAVLMSLVQNQERPMPPMGFVEQRTILRTKQLILQHREIGQKNLGRSR